MTRARIAFGWRRNVAVAISILALGGCRLTTDAPTPHTFAIISGDSQSATAGTALPQPLIVIVLDQYGGSVANVTVTWAIASGGGGLSSPSTTTDANGVTSVTYTTGPTPGSATITATVAGIGTLTFPETIT
jgi:hypothetical protein